MKYFSFFALLLLMSCNSPTKSQKVNIVFEDIYHHYFTLTPEKFVIIDSQEKIEKIYAAIGHFYGGKRRPPIPQVTAEEKYILFKPTLKNTNDVEIMQVEVVNQTLYIKTKPSVNPDRDKSSRFSPNILLKIYTTQNLKKIITNTQNPIE